MSFFEGMFFNKMIFGEIPKWPTGADCKSVVVRLRRFESSSPHERKSPDSEGYEEEIQGLMPG